ncbi:hypothetical protein B0F90DRAFT_1813458 [Multifurca ochricompacta]|uniref:F-box domain-containing protein n=1 Tax=Multifurca ochricompacta TaxID=376703 RepID=A0AAD4QS50_9AGAM|nr:hypothetical protein B0F90DRAFT_1813458 [Multifurca ochricompacta]
MDHQSTPLPPPLINTRERITWEQFENRQIFDYLRNQPDPNAPDSDELILSNKELAAQLKVRIAQFLSSPQLPNQRSNLIALGEAYCKRKILLWRLFPFNDLPVEIVINIFRYAVWSTHSSSGGVLSRFRLTWVCKRWRHIAVHDQTLWNTISIKDPKISYSRSKLFFERAGTTPLDLRIEDDSKTRVNSDRPMTGDDMQRIMDIFITKSGQIRVFIVIVEMWPPILVFLDTLHKSSRPFRQLERVEIHRTGRPYRWDGPGYPLSEYQHALTLCNGDTRLVNNLCLNGIHLNWDKCRLANLTSLDLRRMPPDLGPSLERFREILESSPNLKKLSLDGAGPVQPTSAPRCPYPPVVLPKLESLVLGDTFIAYAIFCAGTIHAPNVREMTLLNLVGEDHAPLLKALTGKFPELLILTLYCLNVQKIPQNGRIMAQWLLSMPKVKFMRVAAMKSHMFMPFLGDGRLHITDDLPLPPNPEEEAAILANGSRINVLPNLEAIEVQRIDIDSVVNFVHGRSNSECH